jgi:hypothetical protein
MQPLLDSLLSLPIGGALTASELLLRLLVAGLAGQLIGWLYARSHDALSYSQSYVQALVLLTMTVCFIVSAVGISFARFFVLGTALAIVRFRTPLKEAKDTAFLFLAVGLGVVTGLGLYVLALPVALLVGGTALYMKQTAFGARAGHDAVLCVHLQGESWPDAAIGEVLRRHCRDWQLSGEGPAEGGGRQRIYEASPRDPEQGDAMLRELLKLPGVEQVSLLNRARAGEG